MGHRHTLHFFESRRYESFDLDFKSVVIFTILALLAAALFYALTAGQSGGNFNDKFIQYLNVQNIV